MRNSIVFVALVASIGTVSADAVRDHRYGRQVRFVGIHPIPKAEGGGMCNIEAPHVHIYAANKLEYRDHRDGERVDAYFVGDPVAYKYEGPKYAYRGPHPIHVDAVVGGEPETVYCYLEGPHFHYFQPAPVEEANFKLQGDAYFYVGEPPQVFVETRPAFVGINAVYRPLVYTRPVVEVEPPSGWIGARAEFMAPSLTVEAPPPVIIDHRGRGRGRGVVEGGVVGGAVIGADVGIHVALPPPPSIHIGVGVGVGVSGGAGIGVSGGNGGRRHR